MNNWRMKLATWMQGRYGPDALYKVLIGVALALMVLNLFVPGGILYPLSLAFFAVAVFRVFSRNLQKRSAENQKYLALRGKAQKQLLQWRNRFRERNTHRYRACPQCKTVLRLKKQVGTMHVKCPKCSQEFDVTIRR